MGFLRDLFGGTDKSAQRAQERQNRETLDFIKQQTGRAYGRMHELHDEAQAARRQGYNEALKLFGDAIPEQFRVIGQGVSDMQDTLVGGAENVRNALLGNVTDLRSLIKDPIRVDTSFLENRTLPEPLVEEEQASQFPNVPVYSNPNANTSPEVMSAYAAGASPMASANDLAAFNLGVPDLNQDGLISNDEFRSWDGYDSWKQTAPPAPPGAALPGSRFTGEYIDGVPQYNMPTEGLAESGAGADVIGLLGMGGGSRKEKLIRLLGGII